MVNNCSAYQEKIMQSGAYTPCKTCFKMAEELRAHAKKMPQLVEKDVVVTGASS